MPSVRFNVSLPPDQIARLELLLNPKQVKQALFEAVKRTADQIKTIEVDSIVEHSELTRHAANRAVNTIIPRGDIPDGWVVVSGKGVPMIGYRPSISKHSGMTVTAGGKEIVMPHVFKATMKGVSKAGDEFSHVGVFFRERISAAVGSASSEGIAVMTMKAKGKLTPRGGVDPAEITSAPSQHATRAVDHARDRAKKMIGGDRRDARHKQADSRTATPGGIAERLPIHQVFGPSAATFADKQEIETQVKERLDEIMQRNLDSQVDRFLKEAK